MSTLPISQGVSSAVSRPETLRTAMDREGSTKSTVFAGRPRREIEADLEAARSELARLRSEKQEAISASSEEAQRKSSLLLTGAGLMEAIDDARRQAKDAKRAAGEEVESEPGLEFNPLRGLSIALQTKMLAAIQRLSSIGGEITSAEQRIESLNAELRDVETGTPRP